MENFFFFKNVFCNNFVKILQFEHFGPLGKNSVVTGRTEGLFGPLSINSVANEALMVR